MRALAILAASALAALVLATPALALSCSATRQHTKQCNAPALPPNPAPAPATTVVAASCPYADSAASDDCADAVTNYSAPPAHPDFFTQYVRDPNQVYVQSYVAAVFNGYIANGVLHVTQMGTMAQKCRRWPSSRWCYTPGIWIGNTVMMQSGLGGMAKGVWVSSQATTALGDVSTWNLTNALGVTVGSAASPAALQTLIRPHINLPGIEYGVGVTTAGQARLHAPTNANVATEIDPGCSFNVSTSHITCTYNARAGSNSSINMAYFDGSLLASGCFSIEFSGYSGTITVHDNNLTNADACYPMSLVYDNQISDVNSWNVYNNIFEGGGPGDATTPDVTPAQGLWFARQSNPADGPTVLKRNIFHRAPGYMTEPYSQSNNHTYSDNYFEGSGYFHRFRTGTNTDWAGFHVEFDHPTNGGTTGTWNFLRNVWFQPGDAGGNVNDPLGNGQPQMCCMIMLAAPNDVTLATINAVDIEQNVLITSRDTLHLWPDTRWTMGTANIGIGHKLAINTLTVLNNYFDDNGTGAGDCIRIDRPDLIVSSTFSGNVNLNDNTATGFPTGAGIMCNSYGTH